MCMRGFFITGTDTNVGKTVLAAAFMLRYRGGRRLRYWKPIQTGIEQDDDTAEVRRLADCGPEEVLNRGVRLRGPVSPQLAAQRVGLSIDLRRLAETAGTPDGTIHWIVEGAGGALVPVNDSQLMTDWMKLLGLPLIVASRSALGTINHTLLTLECLRSRHLRVAGVVMIGESNPENRAAIERYGDVPVLAEMPHFDPLTPERLAEWAKNGFDSRQRLKEFLA